MKIQKKSQFTQTEDSYVKFLQNYKDILFLFNHEELENEDFYVSDIFDFLGMVRNYKK